jgi:hypothetical protein
MDFMELDAGALSLGWPDPFMEPEGPAARAGRAVNGRIAKSTRTLKLARIMVDILPVTRMPDGSLSGTLAPVYRRVNAASRGRNHLAGGGLV